MAIKVSPELLVARFIKSATNGKVITVRLRRLLSLIMFPVWVIGLFWSTFLCYEGVMAIIKSSEMEAELRDYRKNNRFFDPNRNTFTADNYVTLRMESDLYIQKGKSDHIYYLPGFIGIAFLLPWIILRLTYWVIDADKVHRNSD